MGSCKRVLIVSSAFSGSNAAGGVNVDVWAGVGVFVLVSGKGVDKGNCVSVQVGVIVGLLDIQLENNIPIKRV